MSGRKAKALRRRIYGTDESYRQERRYFRVTGNTCINDPASLRAQYQHAKRGRMTHERGEHAERSVY